jgi:hypothetical protein
LINVLVNRKTMKMDLTKSGLIQKALI